MISLKYPKNLKKYLAGFWRYGCLNFDISKYGNLKKNVFILINKSKVANVMTYSHRQNIQAYACQIIDFS